ncbi:ABC transporter ATP-binding protein [Pararhodospirillum photometricum]|nr:ATP-binding cassette domain-containing protein [Pararhodospirillum photometricum]
MSALIAQDITVHHGDHTLVEPVSFTLAAGQAVTVLGESGAGKTLLTRALLGTLPTGLRASGRLHVGAEPFDPAQPRGSRRLWGRRIAVLPQEPWLALNPLMRAAPQVAEVHALVAGRPDAAARADADLHTMGLAGAGHKWPWQLSGGMAQRLAFAAARAGGATITVADEPTKGLDADRCDDVRALLQQGLTSGGSLLTVTHDLALAEGLGGEILVMHKGQIVERGPAATVLETPQHPYTQALIAADPAHWPRRAAPTDPGEPFLRATGLGVARGGRALFQPVDLTLARGQIIGVAGPSGCGKSSLGNALLGLLPFTGTLWRDPAVAPLRFQKIWQDPPAAFPARLVLGRGLADLIARHRLDPAAVPPLMDRLRLRPDLLERLPGQISGGELQRVALLRALLLDPVFLFADEPTSRLDPVTQAETLRLLSELVEERGMGVLIVSHDSAVLAAVCDTVLRLQAV